MRLTLLSALLLLTAGCMGGSDPSGDGQTEAKRAGALGGRTSGQVLAGAEWAELALPFGPDHNHRDLTQHTNLSTPNFELIGYEPLITDYYGTSPDGTACGDVKTGPDGRRLAVVHSFFTDVSFVIYDVTDVTDPKKVGEMVMSTTQTYDVAITPDLRHVLVASSAFESGPDMEPPTGWEPWVWRDACTGEETILDGPEAGLPFYSGLVLVDISNPRAPFVADFRPFPWLGVHSVRTATIKDRDLIIGTVTNVAPGSNFYVFMDILELPGAGAKLNVLSVYEYQLEGMTPDEAQTSMAGGNHDAYMAVHPITGEALAYLAYAGEGLVIVNIDDPTNPQFLSRLDDTSAIKGMGGNMLLHHALPATEAWDGKHYTFVGEECVSRRADTPSCRQFSIDTTDPKEPKFVGAWTLPVDVEWERGLTFSMHYIALLNRTFFATTYHGGLWAIDVSTEENLRTMPSIGVFLPDTPSPKPPGGQRGVLSATYISALGNTNLDDTPTVLDLDVLDDGTLLVTELASGAHLVRFDETNPAPAPAPWPFFGETE